MDISVIGTGYVGLVAGAVFADAGNRVICADKDLEKLEKLKNGIIPIYEPGLEKLIKVNVAKKRLRFSSNLKEAVQASEICFIAVDTPLNKDGSADISSVVDVAVQIAKSLNGYKIIVNKSTVPVGELQKIEEIIKQNLVSDLKFDIVSNPEFLRQGSAISDFLHPERVIIGSNSEYAISVMRELYAPFLRTPERLLVMDIKSAEMTKYAANSFLATKISFMNEMANLCEKLGADIENVRKGIASDSRIGNKFLLSGLGYGGSCFPKDTKALINIAKKNGCNMRIISATDETNSGQRTLFLNKVIEYFGNNLSDKTLSVWGLSFKPNTNDMREAPSVTIVNELLAKGAKIQVYDPKATVNAKKIFGNKVEYANSSYEALKDADALLLLTEWKEFRHPDFEKMKTLLRKPIIFDGRNQYSPDKLRENGFEYICIGR